MPKRKAKKVIKRTDNKSDTAIQREEEKKEEFVDEDVERQIAAIKAIRDAEIGQLKTAIRLLRLCYTEEELQIPVEDFFKENLPDGFSIATTNEETGEIELEMNDKNGENADGLDLNYSILNHLSMGFPDLCSRSSLGGYDLPDNVKASLLGTGNSQLENFAFQGTSESQMFASHDAFQTPGANGQRLSFGMTPKTQRQPKPGEMMLSVHGSPLGVYEEDNNLEAIKEDNSGNASKVQTLSDSPSGA